MKRISFLFCIYTAGCFSIASLIYAVLKATLYGEQGRVFAALYLMYEYHNQYPYQYILVIAVVYGIIATLWAHFLGRTQTGRTRGLYILGVLALTILCSSILGGMLWSLHDMQAGYFPEGSLFWNALSWGASNGLGIGWFIFILSFPYNILCALAGYWLTGYVERKTRNQRQAKSNRSLQ
ncbi:MAG: hypothetical protein WA883_04360 [Phormidesmis sp.]